MLNKSIYVNAALSALAISAIGAAAPMPANAQERPLTISRRAPVATTPYSFTDSAGAWDRVGADQLYASGPRGPSSPTLLRRGRLVPNDVDTAMMRNVSIRGLRPGLYYAYFGTDDSRTVIVNPSTRRVARVLNASYVPGPVASASAATTVAVANAGAAPAAAYPATYGYGSEYGPAAVGFGTGYYDGGYYGGGYYGGGYYGGGRFGYYRPDLGLPGRPGVGVRPGLRPTPYRGAGVARANVGAGRGAIGAGRGGRGGRRG